MNLRNQLISIFFFITIFIVSCSALSPKGHNRGNSLYTIPDSIAQMGNVVAKESRALGIHHCYTPMLGLARDPRWGRADESYGEDPYPVSRIRVAYINGLQGRGIQRFDKNHILATAKHYFADGDPDFVLEVDWVVEQVIKALKAKGLYENTMIVLTSDNGTSPHSFPIDQELKFGHNTSNNYKGRKSHTYEGDLITNLL